MSSHSCVATFLFTELENSTPLWENYPDLMQKLAARHDILIREAIETHRDKVVMAHYIVVGKASKCLKLQRQDLL